MRQRIPVICTLTLTGLFGYLAFRVYVSDSELWSITLGAHFFEDALLPWVASRPLFYGLMGILISVSKAPLWPYWITRALMLLCAGISVFLTFRISRRVSRSPLTPWLACLFLLSNSGFLNQGFRVRSDLMTMPIALWLLDGLLSGARFRALVFRWILLPLTTPKAVFHMVALPACFAWRLESVPRITKERLLRWGTIALGLILVPVLVIEHGSLLYFLGTFSAGVGGRPYFSTESFEFVMKIAYRNPIFAVSLIGGFFFAFRKLRLNDFSSVTERRNFDSFIHVLACSLVWIIFIPEKFPFLLASFLPFFSILAATFFDEWGESLESALVVLSLALASCGASWFWDFAKQDGNREQVEIARRLESYLSQYPGSTMYDIIGILPHRATLRKFVGPNEEMNRVVIPTLEKARPDFIFYVAKGALIEPGFSFYLDTHYLNFGQGVYARAEYLDVPAGPKKKFQQRFQKIVQAYQKSKGLSADSPVTIEYQAVPGISKLALLSLGELAKSKYYFRVMKRISRFAPPDPALSGDITKVFSFDAEDASF